MAGEFRNIKMVIAYEGTNYAGFQRQAGSIRTIQGTIEETINKMTGENVNLIGAGRTDAGVHAKGQVVNFRTGCRIPTERFPQALNSILPNDIVVLEASWVEYEFHSRYDAKAKTYSYHICNSQLRPLFNRNTVYHYRYPLNLDLMEKAAELLKGRRDFKCFQAAGSSVKTTVRTVHRIELQRKEDDIVLSITADGFLYHMVRNIAGTLIEVGNSKISINRFREIIHGTERIFAGPTAPAQGLCLEEVFYG